MSGTSDRREFLKTASVIAASAALGGAVRSPQAAGPSLIERAKPTRLKLSLAAYSFRQYLTAKESPMTLFDFMDVCADLNLDGTELTCYYFPRNPTPEYFAQIKRKAFLLGLDVSGTAISNHLSEPPGKGRDDQMAYTKRWIDYAAAFGAPTIRVYTGDAPKGASLEQGQDWCAECYRELCKYSGEKGIFLALENHGGISVSADLLLTMVEKVNSPWFGINLDSGNFRTKDPYKDMERVAPYAVSVQCKTDLTPQGGQRQPMDYDRVVGILRAAKYRGYVALEYEAKEDPKTGVPKAMEQLRAAVEKS